MNIREKYGKVRLMSYNTLTKTFIFQIPMGKMNRNLNVVQHYGSLLYCEGVDLQVLLFVRQLFAFGAVDGLVDLQEVQVLTRCGSKLSTRLVDRQEGAIELRVHGCWKTTNHREGQPRTAITTVYIISPKNVLKCLNNYSKVYADGLLFSIDTVHTLMDSINYYKWQLLNYKLQT